MSDAPYLPDYLLIEILVRLPTKSLCRFKCVSKAFERWIMDFLSDRQRIKPMSAFLLYFPYYLYIPVSNEKDAKISLDDFLFKFGWKSLVCLDHSCNGLLLYHLIGNQTQYFVGNPATTESVILPAPITSNKCSFCCLAFDPYKSPHYKVVRFNIDNNQSSSGPKEEEPLALEIYSSLTGKWVQLSLQTKGEYKSRFHAPVFHKGSLYWLCSTGVVRFDIEKLSSRVIKYGIVLGRDLCAEPVGVSGGCLYSASRLDSDGCIFIWLLEEGDQYKWNLKNIINMERFKQHPLTRGDIKICKMFRVLAFHPDSEVIYLAFYSSIVSYEPSTGMVKLFYRQSSGRRIQALQTKDPNLLWARADCFTPCLESLDPP